jgi:hypothetical protein
MAGFLLYLIFTYVSGVYVGAGGTARLHFLKLGSGWRILMIGLVILMLCLSTLLVFLLPDEQPVTRDE